jgi:hypothetical protein
MRALKYIGIFVAGFLCAIILVCYWLLPERYDEGVAAGEWNGQMEELTAIEKEFGVCEVPGTNKVVFQVYGELISIETNGVKTIRVVP